MRINFESPAVKWPIFSAIVILAGLFIAWIIHGTFFGPRGLPPDKLTSARMVCTNPDCPGRTHETAPPGAPEDETGPYMYKQLIRGDFDDWPVPCPKCGQRSVYHKIYRPGGFLILYRMSDPSVMCPYCGEVIGIESPIGGPIPKCPRCGKSVLTDVWQAPSQ